MMTKREKLYLDTSILGFALYKDDLERTAEANSLLRQIRKGHFVGGYSFVTEAEIMAAPPRIARRLLKKVSWACLRRIRVRSRARVHDLARLYCRENIIPEEFLDDALHVAVATFWRADALVSYNFKHLVRLETMIRVNAINRSKNLAEIFLCQPSEVIVP